MLYVDDTLDEEDVLMIFDELEVQNSRCICKSRSREADISSRLPCRQAVDNKLRLRCMSRTTRYTDNDQANKLVFVFDLVFKVF